MLSDDDIKKIRDIIKEEIKSFDIIDYVNKEIDKTKIEKEISSVKNDLKNYDNELNIYSLEYRIKELEKLILGIEKINKIILKLIITLFAISLIMLISFILLRVAL